MDQSTTNCPVCGAVNDPSALLGEAINYACHACGAQYAAINDNAEEAVE